MDAIVTDPPYGLSNTKPAQVADVLKAWVTGDDNVVPEGKGFMGKSWDGFVPPPAAWKECMRVLKPGGHMAVFAGARTQDLMGLSIRLAGFDIRDGISWITGSGFPKGQDLGKAIDKMKGAKREVVGTKLGQPGYSLTDGNGDHRIYGKGLGNTGSGEAECAVTAPATDEARKWDGWNTQLKPAQEPIVLARKPLVGTVAANVLAHGVGGLNIDACRVPGAKPDTTRGASVNASSMAGPLGGQGRITDDGKGRFPANVLLDEHAAQEMDKQSGFLVKRGNTKPVSRKTQESTATTFGTGEDQNFAYDNGGGASRFFPVFKYQAKAPKKERPVVEREDGTKIQHPTVKPEKLMEWLVELITPPGGVVLDPFAGSGTTLQAALNKNFHAIGIEQDADYIKLINKRLEVGSSTRNS